MRVRENADGKPSRTIEGYAIVFNELSDPLYEDEEETVREMISPDAVTKDVLDASDIKMTMFHDREILLARSNRGKGTLSYSVDEKGVFFSFEAPETVDGDKALALVRRGDIAGCSFAFSAWYSDPSCVTRSVEKDAEGKAAVTYTVRAIDMIYDFTLAADPAYPQTQVGTREMTGIADVEKGFRELEKKSSEEDAQKEKMISEQVRSMRKSASLKLF